MTAYPYFRWFPGDAETDLNWRLMNYAQRGFFMTCLDLSWINGGLPSDLDELSIVMGCTRELLDEMWTRVGRCFVVSESTGNLVNVRQEKDLQELIEKSRKASESGKQGGRPRKKESKKRTKSERFPDAKRTLSEGLTRARDRADSDIDIDSSSEVLSFAEQQETWWREIWKEYPRHTDTGGSQKSFRKAATSEVEYAAILEGLRKQLPELRTREQKFIPHFATWLNQRRWLDEPNPPTLFPINGNGHAPDRKLTAVEIRDAEIMRRAVEYDAEQERLEELRNA